jgi:hypothetical protein
MVSVARLRWTDFLLHTVSFTGGEIGFVPHARPIFKSVTKMGNYTKTIVDNFTVWSYIHRLLHIICCYNEIISVIHNYQNKEAHIWVDGAQILHDVSENTVANMS